MLRRRKNEHLSHVEDDPWAHLRPFQMAYNAVCSAKAHLPEGHPIADRLEDIRADLAPLAFPNAMVEKMADDVQQFDGHDG